MNIGNIITADTSLSDDISTCDSGDCTSLVSPKPQFEKIEDDSEKISTTYILGKPKINDVKLNQFLLIGNTSQMIGSTSLNNGEAYSKLPCQSEVVDFYEKSSNEQELLKIRERAVSSPLGRSPPSSFSFPKRIQTEIRTDFKFTKTDLHQKSAKNHVSLLHDELNKTSTDVSNKDHVRKTRKSIDSTSPRMDKYTRADRAKNRTERLYRMILKSENTSPEILKKYEEGTETFSIGGGYLDLGCGDGSITKTISDKLKPTFTYYADINPECERKFADSNSKFLLIKNDTIPLPDNSLKLVSCFMVLHHVMDQKKMFSEISRVLEPGGYMYIREHDIAKNPAQIIPYLNLFHIIEVLDRGWKKLSSEIKNNPKLDIKRNIKELSKKAISYTETIYYISFHTLETLSNNNGMVKVNYHTYESPNPQNTYHCLFRRNHFKVNDATKVSETDSKGFSTTYSPVSKNKSYVQATTSGSKNYNWSKTNRGSSKISSKTNGISSYRRPGDNKGRPKNNIDGHNRSVNILKYRGRRNKGLIKPDFRTTRKPKKREPKYYLRWLGDRRNKIYSNGFRNELVRRLDLSWGDRSGIRKAFSFHLENAVSDIGCLKSIISSLLEGNKTLTETI